MTGHDLNGKKLDLVLASQSPRRIELMREAGYEFDVLVPDVEEAHDPALTPEALTIENARRKAVAAARQRPEALVIGADTLVYVDGEPLGKPRDLEEALGMMRRLSGRGHQVCTGVYLATQGGAEGRGFHVITEVAFLPLTEDVIRTYHARVNPLDKAGAYGIQEASEMILERYEGSWTNVMGLPMERLGAELEATAPNSTEMNDTVEDEVSKITGRASISLRVSTPFDTSSLSKQLGLRARRVIPRVRGLNYWCGEMEDQKEIHSYALCDLVTFWIQHLSTFSEVIVQAVNNGGEVTLVLGMFVDGNLGYQLDPSDLATLAQLKMGFICEVYAPA